MPVQTHIFCRIQHLKQVGAQLGLDFTNKTDRFPNTLQAHALLEHTVEKYGETKQNEVAEHIFKVRMCISMIICHQTPVAYSLSLSFLLY